MERNASTSLSRMLLRAAMAMELPVPLVPALKSGFRS